jgi:hypothetical protein
MQTARARERNRSGPQGPQAWFWTPEWQAGEREADLDRNAGRVEEFETGSAFLDVLHSIAKPKRTRKH